MKATRTMNMLNPFGKGFLPGQVKTHEVSLDTIQRIKDSTTSIHISYHDVPYNESKRGHMGRV